MYSVDVQTLSYFSFTHSQPHRSPYHTHTHTHHKHSHTMVAASNNTDAPSITIFGATGIQGGSVLRHLLTSDKPYRIRAVTRDSTKPAAQKLTEQGVEVVQADLGNQDEVEKAVKGQDLVFVSPACVVNALPPLLTFVRLRSSLARLSPTSGNTVVKRKSPTVVDSWISSNPPVSRRYTGLVSNP